MVLELGGEWRVGDWESGEREERERRERREERVSGSRRGVMITKR
jgi:hypothetical protein